MTFKVGEKAYIVENHSYVTPVVILRSYGDFYTVAAGGAGINVADLMSCHPVALIDCL